MYLPGAIAKSVVPFVTLFNWTGLAPTPVLGVVTVFCFTNPFVAAPVSQSYIFVIVFPTDVVVKA